MSSEEGVQQVKQAANQIVETLERHFQEMSEQGTEIKFHFRKTVHGTFEIREPYFCMIAVGFGCKYTNSVSQCVLRVIYIRQESIVEDNAEMRDEEDFLPRFDHTLDIIWKLDEDRTLTTGQLIEHIATSFMNQIEEAHRESHNLSSQDLFRRY